MGPAIESSEDFFTWPRASPVTGIAACVAKRVVRNCAPLTAANTLIRQTSCTSRGSSVIQVSFGLAAFLGGLVASLGVLWVRHRHRRAGGSAITPGDSDNPACRAVFEQSPNGMLIADADTLQIIEVNPALERALGYTARDLSKLTVSHVFLDEGDDQEALLRKLRDLIPRTPIQLRQRSKDGTLLTIEVSGHRLELGKRCVLALTTDDVTLRRKAEAQLLEKQQHLDHLAHHDQLTGLPNRLYLAAHLPGAIEEARRSNSILAVLFLDLDRFKHINDSRGHETGDQLLKAVAERIRATVRTEDVVVRMGGDEFIVVLRSVRNSEQVNDTAVRINEALSAPVLVDGRTLVTTVSIGVSLYPRDGADMGELLRHSDTAMYQAKDRGRNNFQLFSPAMDRRLKERMAIESSLRAALQAQQLAAHYQPIIDINTNRVVAMEALLRWKHPAHGFVSPDRFIAIAEETGLIVPIGDFVLARAVEDIARWRQSGCAPVPVAVNVSAVQLQRSNLPDTILKLTKQYGVKPSMLQLELTESAVFERREGRTGQSSEDAVSQLRDIGVRIAVDDFGTGYSSLSYLKRWRVDYLKIDRSFVRDLVTDMSDLAIVSAIIAMARHLNIQVVAEGIEGWQQLEKLRQLGCSLAQGYLLAKPAPEDQCRRFLTGTPLDLTEHDPLLEALGATGS
ncbi:MAG TPA: EAL domain-containing protein [Steroidobacteraceae bacterium]|nr:EAL domain-containing protein [Steroidobacteraceae bacterium]